MAWRLALADVETPVGLAERLRSPELVAYLRFHTGAEVTTSRPCASFARFAAGYDGSYCAAFPLGTDDCPELSATHAGADHPFCPSSHAVAPIG
ncbi:MAG: phosphonate C-P lyase system protein PhnH [Candidatus Tectimicrobiota bacterium]